MLLRSGCESIAGGSFPAPPPKSSFYFPSSLLPSSFKYPACVSVCLFPLPLSRHDLNQTNDETKKQETSKRKNKNEPKNEKKKKK